MLANSKMNMKLLFDSLVEYVNLTDMEIHPTKSALSILNDIQYNLAYKNNSITLLENTNSYKYLGINFSLKLDVHQIHKSKVKQFKNLLHYLCTKRYLDCKHIIKIINCCLISKLLYSFQIFLPNSQKLISLDNEINTCLNRFVHIPKSMPHMYWLKVRKLKSICFVSSYRYVLTRINQGFQLLLIELRELTALK